MFYVYEWFINDTNEIIYVGKGTKNRYKVRKHNRLFNEMIKRFDCSSRIIKTFENEEDAFRYEYDRVNELKEIGQCICNIHKGGYGGSISWWTDELREKYSHDNVMKAESQRKRMSEKNPMSNPLISERVNGQKRKSVIVGNVEYESIKSACEQLGVYPETIHCWCKKGVNPSGELCRFKDSEQVVFKGGRYNKGGCRPLTYLGKHYESGIDLAHELGHNYTTIWKWLKKGFDSNGNPCRYDDDNANHVFKPNKYEKKAVIVNGIHYQSIEDAVTATGVCRQTIVNSLKGTHKSRKVICEYDNQKPSQGNSNNSTLEGSTTNK